MRRPLSPRRPLPPRAASLALLLALGAAPACVAVAAGGVGLVISQEFVDNAHVVHYDLPAAEVWGHARALAPELADDGTPVLDDAKMTAELTVEGGRAGVKVEATGPRACRMLVGARKFGVNNASLAHFVMVRIDSAIDR